MPPRKKKLLLRERGEKSRTKIETKERQKLGSQLAGKHAASQAKLANVNYSASCGQVFNTSRKEILFTSCLEIGRPRAVDNARTLPGHRLGQHTMSTSIRRARTENREWKYRKKAKKDSQLINCLKILLCFKLRPSPGQPPPRSRWRWGEESSQQQQLQP